MLRPPKKRVSALKYATMSHDRPRQTTRPPEEAKPAWRAAVTAYRRECWGSLQDSPARPDISRYMPLYPGLPAGLENAAKCCFSVGPVLVQVGTLKIY